MQPLDYTVLIIGFITATAKGQNLSSPTYIPLLPRTLRALGRSRSYQLHTSFFNWNSHVHESPESPPPHPMMWQYPNKNFHFGTPISHRCGSTQIINFIWAHQPAIDAPSVFLKKSSQRLLFDLKKRIKRH